MKYILNLTGDYALKPSFFRKAGRFKIIGRVNND